MKQNKQKQQKNSCFSTLPPKTDLLGYVFNNSEYTFYEVKCCKVAFNTVWGGKVVHIGGGKQSEHISTVILHGSKA